MAGQRTVFNHVGLCVSDTARSRRFYEGLLDAPPVTRVVARIASLVAA